MKHFYNLMLRLRSRKSLPRFRNYRESSLQFAPHAMHWGRDNLGRDSIELAVRREQDSALCVI